MERHAALQWMALHARAEDHVRFTVQNRLDQFADELGCVLCIAVKHRDRFVTVFDRTLVRQLLAAAVAFIFLISNELDTAKALFFFESERDGTCAIAAVIIDDENFGDRVANFARNTVKHRGKRQCCIVRRNIDRGFVEHRQNLITPECEVKRLQPAPERPSAHLFPYCGSSRSRPRSAPSAALAKWPTLCRCPT